MNAPVLDGLRVLELAHSIAGQYLASSCRPGRRRPKAEPPDGALYRSCPSSTSGTRQALRCRRSVYLGWPRVRTLPPRRCPDLDFPAAEAESLRLDYNSLRRTSASSMPGSRPTASTAPSRTRRRTMRSRPRWGMYAAQPSFSGEPVMITIPSRPHRRAARGLGRLLGPVRQSETASVSRSRSPGSRHPQPGLSLDPSPPRRRDPGPRHPQGLCRLQAVQSLRRLVLHACGNNVFFNKFWIALGRPDLPPTNASHPRPGASSTPTTCASSRRSSPHYRRALRDYWLQFLQANDVPSPSRPPRPSTTPRSSTRPA
jgi:hypothetical protein